MRRFECAVSRLRLTIAVTQMARMKLSSVLALVILAALGGCTRGDDGKDSAQAKADRDALQGTWKAVRVSSNGMEVDAAFIKEHPARFVFNGDAGTSIEATTRDHETRTEFKFSLNPAKSPKQMVMKILSGPIKGQTEVVIYELKADKLKLGVPAKPGLIPERFDQENVAMLMLERSRD